jgi:hypothetical protein
LMKGHGVVERGPGEITSRILMLALADLFQVLETLQGTALNITWLSWRRTLKVKSYMDVGLRAHLIGPPGTSGTSGIKLLCNDTYSVKYM